MLLFVSDGSRKKSAYKPDCSIKLVRKSAKQEKQLATNEAAHVNYHQSENKSDQDELDETKLAACCGAHWFVLSSVQCGQQFEEQAGRREEEAAQCG